jgi:hypothetical protein
MTDLYCINLTYKSPNEDTEEVMHLNPDGTINVKCTLMALRDMLTQNANIINKLIEKFDIIVDIIPIGYGVVGISTNYPTIAQSLVDINVLTKNYDEQENEEILVEDFNFSEEETNQDRLNSVTNLINQLDLDDISNHNLNSDSDSDSCIIKDDKNTRAILNKYIDITNDEKSDVSSDQNSN